MWRGMMEERSETAIFLEHLFGIFEKRLDSKKKKKKKKEKSK